MRNKAVVIGSVLAALIVGVLIWFGILIFQRETANFRGDVSARERTQANGAYRIAAYDYFFDLCGSIQSLEDRIRFAEDKLAREPDNQEAQTELDGLRAQRSTLVREYNASANKDYTVGQFLDADLPYQIHIDEQTTCSIYE